jgi:hypothetical protein
MSRRMPCVSSLRSERCWRCARSKCLETSRITNFRKARNPLNLKDWLGGLDSNQSLESYQLDDLPKLAWIKAICYFFDL